MAGSLGAITGQIRLDVRQAVAAYAAVRAQNARTVYALRGTGDSFIQAGQTMGVAGAGMVYAFSRVVLAAGEFERKMDYAAAVSGTTGAQIQKLSDYALQLGKDTIYSAGEIADGFIELAKAGVSANQIINGIGEAMANLGAAGDIPLMESGQIITSTIQQFDLSARNAVKVTDLLAGAANASIADITDIGVSLKYVGGVANAAGLSFEDTTTAISLLAKAGIRGSTAGTSLRQMIVSLGGATGPAREALSELGILAEDGSNKFFDAQGNAKSLSQVFQILQNSTADLTNKQRLMYLRTIFNNRALSAASILTRDGAKGFREMNREMSKVTAAEVASQRLDNLSGDIEILRGNIETLIIEQGGPFQETVRGWVQTITELIQKFSELDPETQKMILQIIGISGVVLLAMAAISLIIGVIARFIASALKMGAAMKFLGKLALGAVRAIRGFAFLGAIKTIGPFIKSLRSVAAVMRVVTALFSPLGLAIAAVLSMIAAQAAVWVLLYKKVEPIRRILQTLGAGFAALGKGIGRFFKLLATDPKAAFAELKAGVIDAFGEFKKVPGLIGSALASGFRAIVSFVSRSASAVGSFVTRFLSLMTFSNLMSILSSVLGRVVSFFTMLGGRMGALAGAAVQRVVAFFQRLPGRVGYLLGFMAGRAVRAIVLMSARMVQLVSRLVARIITFFARLPGRVASFLASMVARAVAQGARMAAQLPNLASRAVTGVLRFIQRLPGRVAAFLTQMVSRGREKVNQMKTALVQGATQMVTGFISGIQQIPTSTGVILGRAIDAIKGKITQAFNAVKDFAANMWKGFKAGLGINSPSLIERQMVQMVKVVEEETKNLRKGASNIQKISKNVQQMRFGTGLETPQGTEGYRRLADMTRNNRNRSETLLKASGSSSRRDRPIRRKRSNAGGRKELVISNWRTGEGYFREMAQDVVDVDDEFYETVREM